MKPAKTAHAQRVSHRKRAAGMAALLLTVGGGGLGQHIEAAGGPESVPPTASGELPANVQEACDRAEAGTAEVEFTAPGGPVDGTALQGKSIFVVAITNTGSVAEYTSQMEDAAALLGATSETFDAQGSIQTAVTGFNQAIARGADVIVNVAVDPALVESQMVEAQSNGIVVIDVVNSQPDAPAPAGIDGRVSWDYIQGGRWRMDQAICATNGQLNLGFISSEEIAVGALLMEGLQAEMDELCPDDCSIVTTNVSPADWATGLDQAATNLVQRNPDLNYLMPSFGGMVTPVLSALERMGRTGEILVSSFDLESSLFEQLKSGEIQADIGTSFGALAWPTLDQALRLVSGEEAVVEVGPVRMVTTELANELGLSSDNSAFENQTLIFGDLVTGDGYKALWGLDG